VTGLHINGATGRPSVVRTSGSADVAWESDVTSEASTRASADTALSNAITSEASARATADASLSSAISAETTRAKAAEATAVSGTLGVIAANKDEQGTGLHLDGATGNASFTSSSGSFDLASYATATTMPTLYTSSTTLTVGSGKSIAVIQAVGGGGSGCSVKGTSIANSTYGAGGAAGGYVNFHIAVSSGDTIGITVGAGASSPVNTINGQTNGGDTIVTLNGTEVARASGGTGGVWNSVASCAGGTGGGASTQNGATPITYSNGTDGGDGQTGAESISSVTGYGGAGVWGGGGRAGNGGGNSGTGFGAGGGGAYDTSYSDTFYGGGAGHDGCAIVEIK
ncbi:glycine-rich domain-containing protein, partial [Gluconobacter sphaericus]|uniref:glycine-rich domain-containing protein n=1 Tax=Gluconobacter sphaericus TaxID=574987 RepID=UPI002230A908